MTVVGITGAAGALGRRITDYVLRSHPAEQLVLLSRTPNELVITDGPPVTVRQADFDEPDTLREAFAAIDVLILISTNSIGRRAAQHAAAIVAAAKAGVERIVYTSLPNANGDFPARLRPVSDDHAATEAALCSAGPTWTVLRNALYMEAYADTWQQAGSSGRLVTNNGAGRHAPVARDDCAAAAAAVLLGDGHDNRIYDITGPRLVDDFDIADALESRYGRSVDVVHLGDQQLHAKLLAAGTPPEIACVTTGFGRAIRENRLFTPLGDTEPLIGRSPVDITAFL
jgi:NAD(P)H dehydrogenase (quinone)